MDINQLHEIKVGIKLGLAIFIVLIMMIILYSYYYRYSDNRLQNLLVNRYLSMNKSDDQNKYSFTNIKYNDSSISGDLVKTNIYGETVKGDHQSFDFKNICDYIDIECIIR